MKMLKLIPNEIEENICLVTEINEYTTLINEFESTVNVSQEEEKPKLSL